VLGFVRTAANQRILVFANFSEQEQTLPVNLLRIYGLGYQYQNLLHDVPVPPGDLKLGAYDFLALASR
jgi:amylosucrase